MPDEERSFGHPPAPASFVRLRFTDRVTYYNAGEVAGFPPAVADQYLRSGKCVEVPFVSDEAAEASPVPRSKRIARGSDEAGKILGGDANDDGSGGPPQ